MIKEKYVKSGLITPEQATDIKPALRQILEGRLFSKLIDMAKSLEEKQALIAQLFQLPEEKIRLCGSF